MSTPHELYDERFQQFVSEIASHDLHTEEATTAVRNLKTFSECRPPVPEPEPIPAPVPTTTWEKVRAQAACAWDNETTRVLIKAGGAFAGVALVVYSTIRRDHVVEKTALSQANQRSV